MQDYKSRKFILALIGLVISSLLVWVGKIDGDNFVMLNSVLGGAYMVANAYQSRSNINIRRRGRTKYDTKNNKS